MEKGNRFVELFRYLKDPLLVSSFQRMCGVRGTFSRTVCAGNTIGSGKEASRAHSHNNGACHRRISGGIEGESLAVIGAGEGDRVPATTGGIRKRTVEANALTNHGDEGGSAAANGVPLSATETCTAGSSGRRPAGGTTASPGCHSGGSGAESDKRVTEKGSEVPGAPPSSTLKPLRKNSLTGDAGQEFLIENRFLYYLFTFGTELGNELFYITFFPFVIWNVDAFVGRRLIMVWVWVMYLGQCTKDVIGWSRPASPPVVKVEVFYNSEYSMPSTHAMSGTAIPFALFFMTYGRWEVK